MNELIIENVAIPLVLGERFIPPDLWEDLKYCPNFIRFSKSDWTIQAYISYILKQIDKIRPNGYDGDSAFQEFVSYIGMNELGKLMGVL